MKRAAVIKGLIKAFPDIQCIAPGEDYGWSSKCIFLGNAAEGGTIDGVAACNYYAYDEDPYETIWVMGVHRALRDFLEKRGWYVECQDPGTYKAFPSA